MRPKQHRGGGGGGGFAGHISTPVPIRSPTPTLASRPTTARDAASSQPWTHTQALLFLSTSPVLSMRRFFFLY